MQFSMISSCRYSVEHGLEYVEVVDRPAESVHPGDNSEPDLPLSIPSTFLVLFAAPSQALVVCLNCLFIAICLLLLSNYPLFHPLDGALSMP